MQDRDALVAGEPEPEDGDRTAGSSMDFVSNLLQSSYNQSRPGTGEMRHGTEGWQALETSFVVCTCFQPTIGSAYHSLEHLAVGLTGEGWSAYARPCAI